MMREQSKLQRLTQHSLNDKQQRHVVRPRVPVQSNFTSEDTRDHCRGVLVRQNDLYDHRDHLSVGPNGQVSPVSKSKLQRQV